jgi:hypothetical protein
VSLYGASSKDKYLVAWWTKKIILII